MFDPLAIGGFPRRSMFAVDDKGSAAPPVVDSIPSLNVTWVGSPITVACLSPTTAPTITLDAAPGGAAATFGAFAAGGSIITPDVAGRYDATVTMGHMKRAISILAFPVALQSWATLKYEAKHMTFVTAPGGAQSIPASTPSRSLGEMLRILRGIARDPRFDATALTNLIAATPAPPWLGFDPREFGG